MLFLRAFIRINCNKNFLWDTNSRRYEKCRGGDNTTVCRNDLISPVAVESLSSWVAKIRG